MMAGTWLTANEPCCFICGDDVESGYHFCQSCRERGGRPVYEELLLHPVTIVECHPSDGPRLSACGYRLVAEIVDPDRDMVTVQAWAKSTGD